MHAGSVMRVAGNGEGRAEQRSNVCEGWRGGKMGQVEKGNDRRRWWCV